MLATIITWLSGAFPFLAGLFGTVKGGIEVTTTVKDFLQKQNDQLKDADQATIEKIKAQTELVKIGVEVAYVDFWVWLVKALFYFVPILLWVVFFWRFLERIASRRGQEK